MDAGPIIAQAAVPVAPSDTPEMLAARVLQAEHRLYPHALALVASGTVRVVDERVIGADYAPEASALYAPPLDIG
jgi:phosphoribosylglycinamide formyltransferase-1